MLGPIPRWSGSLVEMLILIVIIANMLLITEWLTKRASGIVQGSLVFAGMSLLIVLIFLFLGPASVHH